MLTFLFRRTLVSIGLATFFIVSPIYAATATGKILDLDKHPVAGAKVYLYSWLAKRAYETQSGADGVWTIEVPDPEKPTAVPGGGAIPTQKAYLGTALITATGKGMGLAVVRENEQVEVSLSLAASMSGTVQNEKGQPVPGVKLSLRTLTNGNRGGTVFPAGIGDTFGALISTTTDTEGKWHFDQMDTDAEVALVVDDDRFSETPVEAKAGNKDIIVAALPSITVKGRALLPDGKPAVGFEVSSDGWRGENKTDAEGRFTITRVPEGQTSINIADPKEELMMPQLDVEGLAAGTTRDVGDVTLTPGVLLKGQVLDETGKGLPEAFVSLVNHNVQTDETGHYSLRVPSGQNWLTAYKEGFISQAANSQQVQVDAAVKEQNVPPITLVKGVTVSGTIRDEAGKAIEDAELSTGTRYESNTAQVGATPGGNFVLGPLVPGKEFTIHATGKWDLVGQATFKAPTLKEAGTAPKIAVTLKPVQMGQLVGRIVSPTGEAVPGIKVSFLVYDGPKHDMADVREATSDEQGNVTLANLRPEEEPEFYALSTNSIALIHKPATTRDGKNWKASDAVVSVLNGQIKGHVLDVAGTPVVGAKVAVGGVYNPKIFETDAQGRFSIGQLPQGEVVVLAAKEHTFMRLTTQTGQDVQLQLEALPVPTKDDGIQMLQKQPGGNSGYIIGTAVQLIDPDFIPTIIKRDGANKPDANALAIVIGGMARRTPKIAETWGIPRWETLPQDKRDFPSGVMLAHAAIANDNKEFAAEWLHDERTKIVKTDFGADAADKYFALASIASQLEDPTADAIFDLAMTAADQSVTGKSREDKLDNWGRFLAFSPQLLDRLAEELDPLENLEVQSGAMMMLAPEDLPAAQTLLAKMVEESQTPQVQAIDTKRKAEQETTREWRRTSEDALSSARISVAKALGSQPGRGAIEMLRQINQDYLRNQTGLYVARLYRDNGHIEEATAVLKALSTERNNNSLLAQAGGIALPFDKALASQLFEKELQQLGADQANYVSGYRPGLYANALYSAPLDPATARVRLEAEWAWRQAQLRAAEKKDDDIVSEMRNDAIAMGALDLPRALEMLAEAKPSANETSFAITEIGLFLATEGKFNALNPWEDQQF